LRRFPRLLGARRKKIEEFIMRKIVLAGFTRLRRLGRSVLVWCASIALRIPRAWWPTEAMSAVRLALTCIAAIYLAMLLELDRPEWAGWTVLSVSLATRASSLQKSLWRVVSSIIGCVIAVALIANFAQATLAFDVAFALWLALLTAPATMERGQRSYGFALMGFTVPIVALGTVQQPDQVFSVLVQIDRKTRLANIAVRRCLRYRAASTAFQTAGALRSLTHSLPMLNCPLWIRRNSSMLAIVIAAVLDHLNPSIGSMRSFTLR
jgi:hypothetical protein